MISWRTDEDKAEFPELKNLFKKKRARQRAAEARVDNPWKRRRQGAAKATSAPTPEAEPSAPAAPPSAAAASSSGTPELPVAQPDWVATAASSEEEEGAHEPLHQRGARASATPIVSREEVEGGIWGKHFRIVKSRRDGEYVAWTVTCNFHRLGGRCNQNLSFSEVGSADEARQRLKEWCLRGLLIPDEAGAKKAHMDSKAKMYPLSGVRSEEELDRIANTIA